MGGLFGHCGCNGGNKFGKMFGNHPNGNCDCDGDFDNATNCGGGFGCCSIILMLLLLTNCCGCEIDWCNIIVLYLLLNCGC